MGKGRILVVEDDVSLRPFWSHVISNYEEGLSAEWALSGEESLRLGPLWALPGEHVEIPLTRIGEFKERWKKCNVLDQSGVANRSLSYVNQLWNMLALGDPDVEHRAGRQRRGRRAHSVRGGRERPAVGHVAVGRPTGRAARGVCGQGTDRRDEAELRGGARLVLGRDRLGWGRLCRCGLESSRL